MKTTLNMILLATLIMFASVRLYSQEVRVNAFQHYIRWVNEVNLPRYIKEKDIQDSVMQYASYLLSKRFGDAKVTMPASIDVDYIEVFGKAKMAPMKTAQAGEIQVNIMSFLTRATVGFGVNWSMEVVANQDGKTIYQKKKEHEIEYFSRSGYISSSVWYTPETYVKVYRRLLEEVLTDTVNLPEKVVIGSVQEKEALIAEYVPGYRKAIINAKGNFMGGGNFSMALSEGKDTLARIRYRDGAEQTQEWSRLGIGASLLKDLTGIDFATKARIKVVNTGKLFYDNGTEVKLRITFVGAGTRWTDGTTEYLFSTDPAIVDAYIDNRIVGSLAYVNYVYPLETGNASQVLPQTFPVGHSLRGMIGEDTVYAEYEPRDNIIRIFENRRSVAALLLENAVEGSEYYSGQKMGKNKFTVTSAMNAKKKNAELNEAYYFYVDPAMPREKVERYMDLILMLLFCKGNNPGAHG